MSKIDDKVLQKGMGDFFYMALDLMCISDFDGKLLKVNNAWEKTIGYTVEEMEGKVFRDFIHPDDVDATLKALEQLEKGEEIINFTNRYLTKEGIYKTINWRAKPEGDLIFATASDITENEQVVNGITLEKLLLEETSLVSGVGGWEVDLINNKVIWSNMTRKIHEVSDDFIPNLETGINFYKEGESRETITKLVTKSMETGEGWDVELELVTAKNKEIWVRAIGKAVIKNGVCTRLYGTFQDITEKRKYQQTLEEALQLAREAARAKSSFLSNMSHEIRTPLNAVVGMAHLLLQNNPRTDQVEKLETLKFSANNLMALVNDVLDYSKIEEGKITFENITFSLLETVKNIKQTFKFKAEEKGIRFKVQMDPELPNLVKGDPTRLVQILNNLISNAIKFTEAGKVGLSLELTKNGNDHVIVLFEVSDSGIGMSKNQVGRVFDRFEQASIGTTRKFGGTGLGLSIVKKLLEFQGSQIQIDSEEGKGSTFSFSLKLEKSIEVENPSNTLAKVSAQFIDLNGMRILLVEDNELNQLVATEFLKSWNVVLDYAVNGLEAVEKVTNNNYEVILMDIQMPEMDGYQATMRIKSMKDGKEKIPIIAMTASAMLDVKHKISNIGMVDHILKPFNPNELNIKLARFLPKKSLANEHPEPTLSESNKLISSQTFHIDFSGLENTITQNEGFIDKILVTFLKDLGNFQVEYAKAIKEKNKEDIAFTFHKNKSMIKMLSLVKLENIITENEKVIEQDKWGAIDLENFQKVIDSIQIEISNYIEKAMQI